MERGHEAVQSVTEQMNHVILGKRQEIREIMLAALAGGHILLEDMPGVGKTTLAFAFARAVKLEFHRIQFTPDVLPSDLTGFSIYRREEERFVYQPGSVFWGKAPVPRKKSCNHGALIIQYCSERNPFCKTPLRIFMWKTKAEQCREDG